LFRFVKLIIFLAIVALSFKYHYEHKLQLHSLGRNFSDGEYSSPSAQNQAHIVVYGIQCVQTRKYIGMLDQNRIPYLYRDINKAIDSPQWKQTMVPRMAAANIKPEDITGPLVDIDGQVFLMPDIRTIKGQLGRK
jgi:hypothetical protein